MISSDWQMPENQNPQISNTKNVSVNTNEIQDDIKSALDKILNKIAKKILEQENKQLSLFDDPLIYQPAGKVPFPKNFDLDDKQLSVFANSSNQQKIDDILSKYGIVCPGAESIEITKDISDPLLTVITIKKTFF